jgi:hypothetical protein
MARLEERVGSLPAAVSQQLRSAMADLRKESSAEPVLERLAAIETSVKGLAETVVQAAQKKPQEEQTGPVADVFWPKSLKGAEGYPLWRKALADGLSKGASEAVQMAAAMLDYQIRITRRDMSPEKFCDMATDLSRSLYRFCYALEGVPDADRLDIASAMLRQVKEDIQQGFQGIEVRAIFPNERLNTELMEKMDSGNRLTVSRPMSWLVMEHGPGGDRVLHRAMVFTG